jgi:HEAT repeat protein
LLTLLSHQISNLRKEAALALGEIGSGLALDELEKHQADPDPEVRKSVRLAIQQISTTSI